MEAGYVLSRFTSPHDLDIHAVKQYLLSLSRCDLLVFRNGRTFYTLFKEDAWTRPNGWVADERVFIAVWRVI